MSELFIALAGAITFCGLLIILKFSERKNIEEVLKMKIKKLKMKLLSTIMRNPEVLKLGLFVCVAVIAVSTNAMAADPFEQTYNTLGDWISGNLGLLMALVTFIIAAGISIATKSLSALGWGIVLAFVIGGLGGIATSFFDLGQAAFGTS